MKLQLLVERVKGTGSHFFDAKTLRFFGDTMGNYGVCGPITITTNSGRTVQAYELFRKKAVKHGLHNSAFFECGTYARVFPQANQQAA